MRKFIILFISLVLIGLGLLLILKINNDFDTTLKIENGNLEFDYDSINSIQMPVDEIKVISNLNQLKQIVEEHNFNIKHTYIYIRFASDNKHAYKISKVEKTTSNLYITVTQRELPENETIELIESNKEYIIDLTGNLNEDTEIIVSIENEE